MKAKISIVVALLFSSLIVQATYLRGVWVWNTAPLIGSTAETNIFINQCIADGTTDIYLYANGVLTGGNKTNMQYFITKAKCNNMNVWAMDGYRGYFADWDGRSGYINFINTVISYNNTSKADQRFIGIQGDNEPQDGQSEPKSSFHDGIKGSSLSTSGGGVWKSTAALDREYLMRDWISMTQQAYDSCHAHGLRYGQAMVNWLDDYYGEAVYCTYNGQYKPVLEHIMPYLDDFFTMTYNTNPVNAFNRVKGELNYAETLAAKNRPRIWISCETYCGVGINISYCDTPGKDSKASVYNDIKTIESSASAYTSYGGFNIHDWEGWKALSPVSSNTSDPCTATGSLVFTPNNEKINLYPNPGKGQITISNIHPNATIEVINMLGEILYSEKTTETSPTINLGETPGIYLIKIKEENNIQMSKIVIE